LRTIEKLAALAWILLVAGCGHVAITDAGAGLRAAPRAGDCEVAFFRTKLPERAYDELAALHWEGPGAWSTAGGAQEDMRSCACRVGADAVVVTRDYFPGTQHSAATMTGSAIRYRPAATAAAKP